MSYGIDSMIEVILKEPDDFLKVRETLTRIGIASKKERKLYQSCHILHKRGLYYIVHFKELFALDGKPTDFTESDQSRRNAIIQLLVEWDLITLTLDSKDKMSKEPIAPLSQVKVISHKEKPSWELIVKYNIGKKRKFVPEVDYQEE
jgi:hypothetical protein